MIKPTEGRVLELTTSTKEQRKAISRVATAIYAATGMEFDDIYLAAHGSMAKQDGEDFRNFQKGTLAHKKVAPIYRWICEHYLPLATKLEPEVFDPSLLTRWDDFIRDHGIYEKLSHRLIGGMGLTERSSRQPIAKTPIGMGQNYVFDLECGVEGKLLSLESKGGHTYPFSLHPDEESVLVDVTVGTQSVPVKTDGTLDPLSETKHPGLRNYVFLIGDPQIIEGCAKGLRRAKPIGLDKLDQIALAFKQDEDTDPGSFELHCLNVIFTQSSG